MRYQTFSKQLIVKIDNQRILSVTAAIALPPCASEPNVEAKQSPTTPSSENLGLLFVIPVVAVGIAVFIIYR